MMKRKVSQYKAKILRERMIAADNVLHALEEAWRNHYAFKHTTLGAEIFQNLIMPAQKAMLVYDDEFKDKVLGIPPPER